MALIYIDVILSEMPWMKVEVMEIERFISHANRQIDQTYRRVIENEKIPHHEKIFSIFEEHTEWICKGKAGVPQELGIRVAVVEDEYGFIIDYTVAQNQTDDKIAVPLLKKVKEVYPDLDGCSFDKGFYTPPNKQELKKLLEHTILPKSGMRKSRLKNLQKFSKKLENSIQPLNHQSHRSKIMD